MSLLGLTPRVFLSYSTRDERLSKLADEIATTLRNASIEVFHAPTKVRPSADHHQQIRDGVSRSSMAVVILSREYLAEDSYCQTELALIKNKWPAPRDRVLWIDVAQLGRDEIPPYLLTVPPVPSKGNVPANIAKEVRTLVSLRRQCLTLRAAGLGLAAALLALLLFVPPWEAGKTAGPGSRVRTLTEEPPQAIDRDTLIKRYAYVASRIKWPPLDRYEAARVEPISDPGRYLKLREAGKTVIVDQSTRLPDGKDNIEAAWGSVLFSQWKLFEKRNPDILKWIEDDAAAVARGSAPSQIRLVLAPAGYGKSWLFRGLFRPERRLKENGGLLLDHPVALIHVERLEKWFGRQGRDSDSRPDHACRENETADLRYGTSVINCLRGDARNQEETRAVLTRILAVHDRLERAAILVLDSFDELHPAVQKIVFDELDAQARQRPSLVVYILARPEARENVTWNDLTSKREVVAPEFSSVDELSERWNNRVLFLAWDSGRRELQQHTSFSRFVKIMESSPTARMSANHLIVTNFIIERGNAWFDGDVLTATEGRIQKDLLEELLARNLDTHDRPATGSGQAAQKYRQILEEFAARYLEYGEGTYFWLKEHDLRIPDNDAPLMEGVLRYSGLIDLDPADSKKFRFRPDWIPLALIRKYAERHGVDLPDRKGHGST